MVELIYRKNKEEETMLKSEAWKIQVRQNEIIMLIDLTMTNSLLALHATTAEEREDNIASIRKLHTEFTENQRKLLALSG
ncbi:MAG: hypothetical protein HYT12_03795 [Candidatus Liptonbacteria bacterium]|nr:hypothetical protein [Candidatus Liptonbacteria bacterium]